LPICTKVKSTEQKSTYPSYYLVVGSLAPHHHVVATDHRMSLQSEDRHKAVTVALHQMLDQVATVKTHHPAAVHLHAIHIGDAATHIVAEAEAIRGAEAHREGLAADHTLVVAVHRHADVVVVAADEVEVEVMEGHEAHPVAEVEQAAVDDQEAGATTVTAVALTREAPVEIEAADDAELDLRILDKSRWKKSFGGQGMFAI
jgi:hypothetical protein